MVSKHPGNAGGLSMSILSETHSDDTHNISEVHHEVEEPELNAWPISGNPLSSQKNSAEASDLLLSFWRTKKLLLLLLLLLATVTYNQVVVESQ